MTPVAIRPARPEDLDVVREIVDAAYAVYLPAMVRPPAPMLDDYGSRIEAGEAFVASQADTVVGVLVLIDCPDHLLLDNVAVPPAAQGTGVGRRLVAYAEGEAVRRGYAEIRLYTHIVMAANVAYYESLGWEETHRAEQHGYRRIFMRKRLMPAPRPAQ